MKSKKYAIYVKKKLKIKKENMTFIIKSEIIAITPENLEGLLIVFAITIQSN